MVVGTIRCARKSTPDTHGAGSLPTRATVRYRRSGFGIAIRRGASHCRCLYALPFPSVPPASRPGRSRRTVGRDSRGAGRCAASRRRSRRTPDLSRARPRRLRRAVAASTIDTQPPRATEPGRATLSSPSPPAPRSRRFRLRPSDPPHGTLVETRRHQPGEPLARPRAWADHRPPTRRPTDRDPATHSGSKTSLRHGPEPRAEARSRYRGTRSRRPKTPRTGPDRPATRVASLSDPPARLRSKPACRATRPPRRARGAGTLVPPGRNPGLLRPLPASEEASRTRDRPFRPRRTRRPASEAEKP